MWFLLCWQGDGAADPGIDNEESQEASDSIQKQADSQSSGTRTHNAFISHANAAICCHLKVWGHYDI